MFSVLVCRCVHWGLVGLLVMLCANAVLAQAASKALSPDQEAFVKRHGNYPQLLEREKAFWQALNDQDSTWIQHETDQFLSQDFPLLQAARSGESMDLAFALGPCHYASISLSQAIAAASDRGFPRPMPRRPDFLVPPDIRQNFVENIRRCELIKRHPRSKRLVGAGLG